MSWKREMGGSVSAYFCPQECRMEASSTIGIKFPLEQVRVVIMASRANHRLTISERSANGSSSFPPPTTEKKQARFIKVIQRLWLNGRRPLFALPFELDSRREGVA